MARGTRTNERDDLDLLTVLILVSGGNPAAVTSGVGRVANTSEHVARRHDKYDENGADSPGPSTFDDRCNETKDQEQADNGDCVCSKLGPVDGFFERNGNRSMS